MAKSQRRLHSATAENDAERYRPSLVDRQQPLEIKVLACITNNLLFFKKLQSLNPPAAICRTVSISSNYLETSHNYTESDKSYNASVTNTKQQNKS